MIIVDKGEMKSMANRILSSPLFLFVAVHTLGGCYFSTRVGNNPPQIDTIHSYGKYNNNEDKEFLALVGDNYIYYFPDTKIFKTLEASATDELKIMNLEIRASKSNQQLLKPETCLSVVTKEFNQSNQKYESLGFEVTKFTRTEKNTKIPLRYYSSRHCYGNEKWNNESMGLNKNTTDYLNQLQNVRRLKQSNQPNVFFDKRNNGAKIAGAFLLDTITLPVQIFTGPNLPK